MTKVTKWAYKVELPEINRALMPRALEHELNRMAGEGWELVSMRIQSDEQMNANREYEMVWRRPIELPAPEVTAS